MGFGLCSRSSKIAVMHKQSVDISHLRRTTDNGKGFRDDPTYRLEQPRVPEDTRTRLGGRHHQSPMSPMARSTPGNINHNFVSPQTAMRRATDLCSIFVGNLPPNTEEEHLRELFGAYGRISHVEIVRKPSVNGGCNEILKY